MSVRLTEAQLSSLYADLKKVRSYSKECGLSAIAQKYGITRQRCNYYMNKLKKGEVK